MNNKQKMNEKLALHQGTRLQLAHITVSEVENTTPPKVGLVQINNTISGQNDLPNLYGNEPVERELAGHYQPNAI
jgi:hypothetical protein